MKRYSDFYALRVKLIERWPGIFIPGIPPKKTIVYNNTFKHQGNLDKKYIDMRCRLLNLFCQKLVSNNFLGSSEEFNMFLTSTCEVEKALTVLKPLSYEEIITKYRNVFPGFNEVNK